GGGVAGAGDGQGGGIVGRQLAGLRVELELRDVVRVDVGHVGEAVRGIEADLVRAHEGHAHVGGIGAGVERLHRVAQGAVGLDGEDGQRVAHQVTEVV